MNRWRKSVGEIQARRRAVAECTRAQVAFSRVTACFQQLATCVGSSSDCSRLREELEDTRALAHNLCMGLQKRLTALLTEGDLVQEDRERVERLWVLFLSGLEIFQQDLHKVVLLQDFFPLKQPRDRRMLVNTGGTSEGSSSGQVVARVAGVPIPWPKEEAGPCPDLGTHIIQLETMAQEMLRKVNVPFWSVEATQEAWAEGCDNEQDDEEVVEEMSVETVTTEGGRLAGCCHYPGCRILCMLH
ncbi:regulator of G-protein signaling 9-binding protein [Scleropages formosus]|nr:regulator of G-protein signaling 9-binding protein-like [Scleropages formosus]